jgi:ABC-2 type transport system ATP-binding protein
MTAEPALRLRDLAKTYGERAAVAGVDLDVARGEILGLLGPNGAGKTTTISMACGVVTPTRGAVAIAGIDLARDPYGAKRRLGLVPQELALYDELSARANLAYFGALYGMSAAAIAKRGDWVLGVVGLADRDREPVKRYSGGMKRRLNLACGLLHEPALLVLDEPTVGVDPQSRNHIFDTVRALRDAGMTVVYTTHYMEEVEQLCDRVAIMDAGKIVALGTVRELIAQHAGRGVAIELDGDAQAAADAAAAHGEVELRGTTLHATPRAGLGELLSAIERTGAKITRVESRQANLEAAFLALTGKALRDEGGGGTS